MTRRLVNIMDMPDPEAALLPCPVCGKQPRESSSGLYHEITCYHQYGDADDDIGGVWVTARCDTREQAIAAWNRRHPPASREAGLNEDDWQALLSAVENLRGGGNRDEPTATDTRWRIASNLADIAERLRAALQSKKPE